MFHSQSASLVKSMYDSQPGPGQHSHFPFLTATPAVVYSAAKHRPSVDIDIYTYISACMADVTNPIRGRRRMQMTRQGNEGSRQRRSSPVPQAPSGGQQCKSSSVSTHVRMPCAGLKAEDFKSKESPPLPIW
ncbi:unnamed protein product [Periconia digitata]|uniref:Uncharacterized protein n=1 Tax=Periconia digitata TaxID=1303443 RepID=A0A9W4UEZ6_9PLEO|nr:unnamed protein product [Periconia digitata]